MCDMRVLGEAALPLPAPNVEGPEPAGDAWDRIVSDPRLDRARRRLSIHEIRLMIDHAAAASASETGVVSAAISAANAEKAAKNGLEELLKAK